MRRRPVPLPLAVLCAAVLAGCSNTTAGTPADAATPTTAAPTTTTAPPTSARKPPAAVETFTGTGGDVVELKTPITTGILKFECSACSGMTQVKSDAGIDEDLVTHYTGSTYTGKRWMGLRGGTTSRLQVTAKGPWTLTVQGDFSMASQYNATEPVSGKGDDVFLYRVCPSKVAASHDGSSNFGVWVMTDRLSGPDLAVNEIGKYSGTVMFPASGQDAALVQITANGAWSITPK